MKTTWVLTEEERKQKFEGRKKKRKSGSIDEEMVDGALDPMGRVVITMQELEEVEIVTFDKKKDNRVQPKGGAICANKRALGRE